MLVFDSEIWFNSQSTKSSRYRLAINQMVAPDIKRQGKCLTMAGWKLALALAIYFTCRSQAEPTNELIIRSVSVNNKFLSTASAGSLNLGTYPKNISFGFGSGGGAEPPLRLRGKLEGFENSWREGEGYMFLAIRFFNASGDQIDQKSFPASGESAGWNGTLSSPLSHRRETVIVPPDAAQAWVVISSAGPPTTVGIFVVANLVVTETSSNSAVKTLIKSPFDDPASGDYGDDVRNWGRDGTHKRMAKIIRIGQDPPLRAFAIEDDDSRAHAEWHNIKETAPTVHPGSRLVVEWNEMYSIGVTDLRSVSYPSLPPGRYKFQVIGIDLMGKPDGHEALVNVFVPQPFWRRPLFWTLATIFLTAIVVGGVRYRTWHRMRREMVLLRNQQALERERLRIARDIHDDLGARVTRICMLSAASLHDSSLSEKTRQELGEIKQASRDLVSALYETVWTVNPEYDNLDALGNYLCQMVDQLCRQNALKCRCYVSNLPHNIQISSHVRHNVTMVMKEALHNIIKHAWATEVTMNMDLKDDLLDISIQDNGRGFQPAKVHSGNGLNNMRQRMENIGGSCSVEGKPGSGTRVCLHLAVHATQQLPKLDL